MSIKQTLQPIPGGRWAIARLCITGETIALVQGSPIDSDDKLALALRTLNLPYTEVVLDEFFPKNSGGKRCPTFALMSLWYDLKPATLADTTGKV